jgi:hypothetical protein
MMQIAAGPEMCHVAHFATNILLVKANLEVIHRKNDFISVGFRKNRWFWSNSGIFQGVVLPWRELRGMRQNFGCWLTDGFLSVVRWVSLALNRSGLPSLGPAGKSEPMRPMNARCGAPGAGSNPAFGGSLI